MSETDKQQHERCGEREELTDEQRQNIELKRKEALEKLSNRRKWKQPKALGMTEGCSGDYPCEKCGNTHRQLDKTLLSEFGLRVCLQCKRGFDEFNLITSEDVKKEYLLPEGTIRTLRAHKKPNPRNSSWAPIKLHLRREVVQRCLERWGSFEMLEAERRRRIATIEEKAAKKRRAGGSSTEELEAAVNEGFGPTGPSLHNSLLLALLRQAKRKRGPVAIIDCLPMSLLSLVRAPEDGFVSKMEEQFGQLSDIWYRYLDEEPQDGDKCSQPKAKVQKLQIEQKKNDAYAEENEGPIQNKDKRAKDPLLKGRTSSSELNLNSAVVSVAELASERAENTKLDTPASMTKELIKGECGEKEHEENTMQKGIEGSQQMVLLPGSSKQDDTEDERMEVIDMQHQSHTVVELAHPDESEGEKNLNALDFHNKVAAIPSVYPPKGVDDGNKSVIDNRVRRNIGGSGTQFMYRKGICLPAARSIAMEVQNVCTLEHLKVSPQVVSLLAAAANQYTRCILKACIERAEQNTSWRNRSHGKEEDEEEANCIALYPEHLAYAPRINIKLMRSSKQAPIEWERCSLATA